jgi:PAS domain S-box-containing protein
MGKIVNRYETEIRLGLVAIVILLLLLDFSSTYVLYRLKSQLTDQIDNRLTSALHFASLYLTKSQVDTIPDDQVGFIKKRFGISGIGVLPIPQPVSETEIGLPEQKGVSPFGFPRLDDKGIGRLMNGEHLFRFSDPRGRRLGLSLVRISPAQKLLLVAEGDSGVLDAITRASRKTLYFAATVLVLLIPLTIALPRFILKPFKKMRETARSAGQLADLGGDDEVAEVIQSYENIINQLRRNEAELRRMYRDSSSKADRLERFNLYILKSINSGVVTVDLTGKVVGYNRAAGDILGYAEGDVVGKHYLVAFPDELELGLLIEAGLERGEIISYREIELDRRDGTKLWLGVESSLIFDDNDRTIGITLLFTDLTELAKLQAELEINRRMAALGEMTAGLAHQLRNSMTAVSGFCQLLKKKAGPESDLGDIAESIRSEAANSEIMVSRFLSFARPLRLNVESFDPAVLLMECMDKYRPESERRNISLSMRHARQEISCIGDVLLLKEAFGNLIDNSIRAVDRRCS